MRERRIMEKAYDPAADLSLVKKAKETNKERDQADRQTWGSAPPDQPLDLQARTVMMALDAGMRMKDWNCVAEAYAMMIDLHTGLRGADR